MEHDLIPIVFSAVVSGVVSGMGAYVAIRVEIAVMNWRMKRADEDRAAMSIRIDDAHERIDQLQRSRMKTL